MFKNTFTIALLLMAWNQMLQAQKYTTGEILITEEESQKAINIDPYSSFKKEVVSQEKIADPTRQTLSEIVQDQVGIDTQTYCANCGAKRLTINGLKGEHTSILVDGVPLHSAISSFYGVDNIPALGLANIEVMRGAGASLSNPEAIGGTLNLITVNPLDFESQVRASFGVNDQTTRQSQNYSFLTGHTSQKNKLGFVLGGSFTRSETWDEDSNNVAELPQREGKSLLLKGAWNPTPKLETTLRLSYSNLEILGGPTNPEKPSQVRENAANEADFVDGDVHKSYIGDPFKITDWVELDRLETAFTSELFLNENTSVQAKGGHARQEQKSIYQHGFDYANVDHTLVADLSVQHFLGDDLSIKGGFFFKYETLRSASENMFEKYPSTSSQDIKKDNFNYSSKALYAEASYLKQKFEANFSLRADHIDINWLELSNEVKEWVLAPRFNLMYNVNDHLTHRFSYGLGYRAPLTFFESGHGNQESGYEVDITELEKAHSIVYNISYNTPNYYLTTGAHYTYIKNMAFGYEEFSTPIRYRNSTDNFNIFVYDALAGYKIMPNWLVEGVLEIFQYDTSYKRLIPNAAIEKRLSLKSTYEQNKWKHTFNLQFVPARNLYPYDRYSDHYQNRNQALEPILDQSLTKKKQRAPSFFVLDTSLSYQLTAQSQVSFTVKNLLDYTQTSAGDSPATWHWHFNHGHYDGLHTWGPNAGRQFILSTNYTF